MSVCVFICVNISQCSSDVRCYMLRKCMSNLSSQFRPVIPEHAAAYVHHMVASLCPLGYSLPENLSANCFDIGVYDILNPCRSGEALGAWAVGGEVSSS